MKNLRVFFLLAFACICSIAMAQQNFKSGYVITLSNDTVFGEVQLVGDKEMSEHCVFKEQHGVVKTFTANDINGYCIPKVKYYVSKEFNGKKIFFEFLIKGRLNVYYLRDGKNINQYYIENDSLGMQALPYMEEIRRYEGKGIEKSYGYLYESTKHNGILKLFMQDAPDVAKDIDRMTKPNHESLIKVAKKYHNIVCDGEACIIYKQSKTLKIGVEAFAGTISYNRKRSESIDNTFLPQIGVMGTIWLPREGSNLYFKTGLLLTFLKDIDWINSGYGKQNGEYDLYLAQKKTIYTTIPLILESRFPTNSFIEPKVNVGLNVQIPILLTVRAGVGANFNIGKGIYASIDASGDVGIFNESIDYYSYSLSAGVGIQF